MVYPGDAITNFLRSGRPLQLALTNCRARIEQNAKVKPIDPMRSALFLLLKSYAKGIAVRNTH